MQKSERTLSDAEEHNKAMVLEYYELLCRQWNFDAARKHLGDHLVQHSPAIADGIAGVRDWVANRPPFTNHLQADVRRVLVDGDFVVLHSLVSAPGLTDIPNMAIVDLFRLKDGKVVEHWDVIQPVPDKARHANGIV